MTRPPTSWLALDQGGQSSRAILYGDDGLELAEARVPVATRRAGDDRVEHDPEEIVASLVEAARQALAQRDAAPWPLAAGLATQRSSIVCWHRESLEALSPVLSWQDRRGHAALAPLRAVAPQLRRLSGLPLSAHYGATKIRWCIEHLPAVRAAATRGALAAGPLATFIASRLTGFTVPVDPANASRTQLWDVARGDWSAELLGLFAVERAWLPAPGSTTLDAPLTALARGRDKAGDTRLAIVTGDQSAVPFAWGPPREDTLYLNLGTGAFLQRATGAQRPEPGALLGSVLYGDATRTLYSLEGTVNGAAGAIEWFAAAERLDLDAAWARWEATDRAARAAPALLFLNGISGLGSPFWRSDFTSRFIGDGDVHARFAALVASIAYLVCENVGELRLAGPIRRAIVTGGLARSNGLLQLIADTCGLPLSRPSQAEATARGLYGLLAGSRAATATGACVDEFAPDTHANAAAGFERWRRALRRALAGEAAATG
ncbi:MAG: FGGY family carbohydrate kinase [Steroidobacteraceae bacterium]